jgi:uncharacterized protein
VAVTIAPGTFGPALSSHHVSTIDPMAAEAAPVTLDFDDESDGGAVEVDRNGFEVLGRDECMQLLATARLGRIGITSGALPVILPVNFRLFGDLILFRTSRGTKLEAATRETVVAFEVDAMDPLEHSGWSVLVTGIARQVDPDELGVDPKRVPRWAPGEESSLVAVSTELVSGRRLR